MPKVEFTVKVPVKITKKGNIFASSCLVFDLFSQGNTEKEAWDNIGEAIKLFITTCFERGTLDAVLKQSGCKPLKKHIKLPEDHKFITIPIPFSATGAYTETCHA